MRNCIKESVEYKLIQEFYGNSVANRSQVALINHIDEGISILEEIQAGDKAMLAFCLHPLVQSDEDCGEHYEQIAPLVDSYALGLAMEYRSVANEYLSPKVNTDHVIRLSPLEEVNDMLIADKVQNRKDFYSYHLNTHPRSKELEKYFTDWMDALDISLDDYIDLCAVIEADKIYETDLADLQNKVRVYEGVLHNIQLNAAVAMQPKKVEEMVAAICDWSYAQRSGNGELSEREQDERIRSSLERLSNASRK